MLDPKVIGTAYLDEASKDCNLDFFVLFSSVSGVLGNVGQADYAAGNAFMDAYAAYRQSLTENGLRHGKTIAFNWTLWKDGGMQAGDETERMMKKLSAWFRFKRRQAWLHFMKEWLRKSRSF